MVICSVFDLQKLSVFGFICTDEIYIVELAICRTKFPVISNFGIFLFYNRVLLYVSNHHPQLYSIYDRFPEVSMLQQRNQSLFIISTCTILQAQHNNCSHKLLLISFLRKIYKGVGMIRAEIGLKNRQIINETYSFRCFLIL